MKREKKWGQTTPTRGRIIVADGIYSVGDKKNDRDQIQKLFKKPISLFLENIVQVFSDLYKFFLGYLLHYYLAQLSAQELVISQLWDNFQFQLEREENKHHNHELRGLQCWENWFSTQDNNAKLENDV